MSVKNYEKSRVRAMVTTLSALSLTAACHRGAGGAPSPSGDPSAAPAASTTPAVFDSLAPAVAAVDLRVEARRGLLSHFEPLLEPSRAVLEKHFGGQVPFPLAFQVVSAGPGRSSVLLQAASGEARALAFVIDAAGAVAWTKEHPLGGVKPGVSEPSLAAGPDGHVCLAWCNASSDSVALRRWAEDGGAFADYDALHVDACNALSVLFWPGHGWLLAVAWHGGATLQLVTLNGGHAFGNDGMRLPWMYRAPAPVSLALDTPDSLLLFRLGQSGDEGSPEYVFANRYSPEGRPMWPGPLSLKRLTDQTRDPSVRVVLAPASDGAIRATLPGSATGGAALSVEVASDGTVLRR
jgi:hypothetical protein